MPSAPPRLPRRFTIMRHGKKLLKLGRTWQSRLHLLRNMTTALIEHQRIRTTPARAKAVRGMADKIITLAKKQNLTEPRKRILLSNILYTKSSVDKVLTELLPRFKTKRGNYTRIRRDGWRRGDGSDMAIIEYRGNPYEQYEIEANKEKVVAKLPDFEFKLLTQEQALYESRLQEVMVTLGDLEMKGEKTDKDTLKVQRTKDQVKFFEKQLDKVKRELTYFKAVEPSSIKPLLSSKA